MMRALELIACLVPACVAIYCLYEMAAS